MNRLRHALFGIYVAVCASALTWPVYDWLGNSIEPFVFGLPFTLVWNIGWILATFVVLLVYHASGARS